jgi:hypothetical protein
MGIGNFFNDFANSANAGANIRHFRPNLRDGCARTTKANGKSFAQFYDKNDDKNENEDRDD